TAFRNEPVGHYWQLEPNQLIELTANLPGDTTAIIKLELDVLGLTDGARSLRVKIDEREWLDLELPAANELGRLTVDAARFDDDRELRDGDAAGVDEPLSADASVRVKLGSMEGRVAVQAVRVVASRPLRVFQFQWQGLSSHEEPSRVAMLTPRPGN